jgi:hypothetical protein
LIVVSASFRTRPPQHGRFVWLVVSGFVGLGRFQERFATEGSGRVRLQNLKDASGVSLCGFVKDTTAAGAIVHSDGWQSYLPPRSQRPPTTAKSPNEQQQPELRRAKPAAEPVRTEPQNPRRR